MILASNRATAIASNLNLLSPYRYQVIVLIDKTQYLVLAQWQVQGRQFSVTTPAALWLCSCSHCFSAWPCQPCGVPWARGICNICFLHCLLALGTSFLSQEGNSFHSGTQNSRSNLNCRQRLLFMHSRMFQGSQGISTRKDVTHPHMTPANPSCPKYWEQSVGLSALHSLTSGIFKHMYLF